MVGYSSLCHLFAPLPTPSGGPKRGLGRVGDALLATEPRVPEGRPKVSPRGDPGKTRPRHPPRRVAASMARVMSEWER